MSPFEEASLTKSFIVRGFTNDKWETYTILQAFTLQEAWAKALHRYQEEPLIVMKLDLWNLTEIDIQKSIETLVLSKHALRITNKTGHA